MRPLSAEDAFRAYEAARHRLPAADPAARGCAPVDTLDAIAERFDVFLLDAFGVLNIGDTAIPGAPERVRGLQQAGKRVLVVSNAASVPLRDLLAKYRGLGYRLDADDIVTSRATLAGALPGMTGIRWGVMAGDAAPLRDLGRIDSRPLGDDPAPYRAAQGFLLIGSGSWTERRQALLEAALREDPRPVLVANPDIVAPRESGFTAEPGHFAHRLADRTGIAPRFFGKPFANIYELAFARLGEVDKARVVMVGDSLHTDILGAQAAGIASALIAGYGFLAGQDAGAAIERSGIRPDYVVARP